MNAKYAGFWIRFVADVIDSFVLHLVSGVVLVAVVGAFYVMRPLVPGAPPPSFWETLSGPVVQSLFIGVYFCVAFPYYVWGHYRWGTTLGKILFRVFVVDAQSLGPITLGQSILRFFGYIVSYLPFGAGFLMIAFHPRKRGLHELIAGTVSITRENREPISR